VGARFFALVHTGTGAHPATCTMGAGPFPGVKSGRSVRLTYHPFYCRGEERVDLYLYSFSGPYGLYKGALYPLFTFHVTKIFMVIGDAFSNSIATGTSL